MAPAPVSDPTADFFAELGQRKHEPLLVKATGTVRLDVLDGKKTERWFVAIDKGDLTVSRKPSTADTTLRAQKALFDGVASGQVNAVAAVLRGEIAVDGDWRLLVLFQRLFPGPSAAAPSKARSAR